MKAKELMIGDWVFSPTGKPYKLRKSDFVNDDAWFEDCRPIPASLERLEKNGWLHDDLCCEFHNSSAFVICGRLYPFCIFDGVQISYVHELQHALRLCGLCELADNFIVK